MVVIGRQQPFESKWLVSSISKYLVVWSGVTSSSFGTVKPPWNLVGRRGKSFDYYFLSAVVKPWRRRLHYIRSETEGIGLLFFFFKVEGIGLLISNEWRFCFFYYYLFMLKEGCMCVWKFSDDKTRILYEPNLITFFGGSRLQSAISTRSCNLLETKKIRICSIIMSWLVWNEKIPINQFYFI